MADRVRTLSLEEIDKALPDLRTKIERSTSNLLGLAGLLVYKLLTGTGGEKKSTLTGESVKRVQPLIDEVTELYGYLDLLTKVLEEAEEARKSMPTFMRGGKLQQISELLGGPSVKLPPSTHSLDKRGLLTADEARNGVSPTRLLEAMDRSYNDVVQMLSKVKSIWADLKDKLTKAEQDLNGLKPQLAPLGARVLADQSSVETKIARARSIADTDPIGADDLYGEIEKLLEKLHGSFTHIDNSKEEALTNYGRAEVLFKQLHDRAIDQAKLTELDSWYKRLEARIKASDWEPAKNGFADWIKEAEQALGKKSAPVVTKQPVTPPHNPPPTVVTKPPTTTPPPDTDYEPTGTYVPGQGGKDVDQRRVVVQDGGGGKKDKPKSAVEDLLEQETDPLAGKTGTPVKKDAPVDPALADMLDKPAPKKKDEGGGGTTSNPRLEQALTGNGGGGGQQKKKEEPPADPKLEAALQGGGGKTTGGGTGEKKPDARIEAALEGGGGTGKGTTKPATGGGGSDLERMLDGKETTPPAAQQKKDGGGQAASSDVEKLVSGGGTTAKPAPTTPAPNNAALTDLVEGGGKPPVKKEEKPKEGSDSGALASMLEETPPKGKKPPEKKDGKGTTTTDQKTGGSGGSTLDDLFK